MSKSKRNLNIGLKIVKNLKKFLISNKNVENLKSYATNFKYILKFSVFSLN